MKQILICKSKTEEFSTEISQCIVTSLLKTNYNIKEVYIQDIILSNYQFSPDIIIAINKDAFLAIEGFAKIKNRPIVYIIHNIENNLIWNHHAIVMNFIITNQEQQLPAFISQNSNYCTVRPIFNISIPKQYSRFKFNLEKIRILLHISDKNLLALIPDLNKSTCYHITIICNNINLFRTILNPSIHTISRKDIHIHKEILKTDIFVGEMSEAALSIHACKPTIIVGQEGYGGIISPLNIGLQTANGFKGRIGGHNGEYIPTDLLIKDIDICAHRIITSTHNNTLSEMSNTIFLINTQNINTITKYIVDILPSKMKYSNNIQLKLSNRFSIKSISDNRYLITDNYIFKHVIILSDDEYQVLKHFREPKTFNEVYNQIKIPLSNQSKIENFLIELLNDHILKIENI